MCPAVLSKLTGGEVFFLLLFGIAVAGLTIGTVAMALGGHYRNQTEVKKEERAQNVSGQNGGSV